MMMIKNINNKISSLRAFLLGFLFLCVLDGAAQTTIIYVNPSSRGVENGTSWQTAYHDLPQALAFAQTLSENNPERLIEVWVTAGIYVAPDTTTQHAFVMHRNVNVYGGFIGDEVDRFSRDLRNHASFLYGNEKRILYGDIALADSATWDGFTFCNSNNIGLANRNGSAAILKGNAKLRNCSFTHNEGDNVIFIDHSGYTLSEPIMNLSYCTITTDSCTAIEASNYTIIDHSTISIIRAPYAVSVNGAQTFLNYCTIENNRGSGVYLDESTLYFSYILNNYQHGVYCKSGNVIGCVIANNGEYGIYADNTSGTVNIINNTIVNNGGAISASGGFYRNHGGNHTCNFYNNVLWGNNNNNGPHEIDYNNTGSWMFYNNAVRGGFAAGGTATVALENANRGYESGKFYPFFVSPTDGCGPDYADGNWKCEVLSSLIDNGTNSMPAGFEAPLTNIDGEVRIWNKNNGGIIDRGAYEYQRTITRNENIVYVKEGGSGNLDGTSWENAIERLDEAVAIALRTNASAVWVAQGTYYGDAVPTNPAFTMFENINVYGGFVGNEPSNYDISLRDCIETPTILDGQNVQRVLYQPADFETTTTWDGFTIQNGYTYYAGSSHMTPDYAHGAGVYLKSNGVLSNCIVTKNHTAVLGGGGYVSIGGGIYAEHNATIKRCNISNNRSENRTGGVFLGEGSMMSNCLVSNNETPGTNGVAIYMSNNTNLENSTVTNNKNTSSETRVGSAIYISPDQTTIKNAIIWGNFCSEQLGGDDISEDANVIYSAVEGGYGTNPNNINLSSENDGEDVGIFYPRFKKPIHTQGNMEEANAEYNTANWSLKFNSPCIDVGTATLRNNDALDLAGNVRRTNQYDLGTYELSDIPLTPGAIVYVTTDGTGDGSSWKHASGDLNYVVRLVSNFNRAVDDDADKIMVWVKHGTYYGDGIPCNPAFKIEPKVNVYGDFFGNEPADYDLSLRNFVDGIATILDGQQKQRVLLQNGYSIVEDGTSNYGFYVRESAIWDGFYIQHGYTRCDEETVNSTANYIPGDVRITAYKNRGAGVFLQKNAHLNNCRILNNRTTMQVPNPSFYLSVKLHEGWGAGVFLSGRSILYNCIITGNSSASRCGGVYLDRQSSLLNCVVTNNESYGVGSCDGLDLNEYSPNTERGGAGVYAFESYIYNTTIVNNKLKQFENYPLPNGAGVFLNQSNGYTTMYNSIVWGNVSVDNNNVQRNTQLSILKAADRFYLKNNAIQESIGTGRVNATDWIILDSLNDGNDRSKYYPRFIHPNNDKGCTSENVYLESNWSLKINSHCVNAGANSRYLDTVKYPTDLVGNARVFHDTIDIGAYEYTFLPSQNRPTDTVIYVTQTGSGDGTSWLNAFGDLQTAIDTAYARNANRENPVNIWVAIGEYYGDLVAGNNGITLREGVNLYGGFTGSETSIEERDFVNNRTVLNGKNRQRVIYQENDFDSLTIISGVYITGGNSNNENGAGVFLRGNGMLDNCVIEGNNAGTGVGGGVYATNGAIINISRIADNTAANGSAAYLVDSVNFTGCAVQGNTATDPDGFTIVARDKVKIDSCQVSNNVGGGIFTTNESNILLSKVTGNTGLGVSADTNVRLVNLLVSSNNKGGVKARYHSQILNNTIVNNYIPSGSAIAAGLDIDSCSVINTIVWNNEKGTEDNQINIANHSILFNNAIQDSLVATHTPEIAEANLNIRLSNANFGSATSEWGYPFFINSIATTGSNAEDKDNTNWGLLPGSSCYNSGLVDTVGYGLPMMDIIGEPRLAYGVIDMGAYETQWTNSYVYDIVYVAEGGRGNYTGVSWDNAMATVQGGVAVAQVFGIDVWVQKGDYYGEAGMLNAFTVGDSIHVYGGLLGNEPVTYNINDRDLYNNLSVLHGQNEQRVLYQEENTPGHSLWSGFIISDGYAASDNFSGNGGGAYIRKDITLDHVFFLDCEAEGKGGGIYSEGNNTLISGGVRNCKSVGDGGGICADTVKVINSLIINNNTTSPTAKGGGLFLNHRSVLVNNNIIFNTTAGGEGGGLYAANPNHNTFILNNILWQNKIVNNYDQIAFSSTGGDHCTHNAIQDLPAFITGTNNINLSENNIGADILTNHYPFFINPTSNENDEDWNVLTASACINGGTNSGQIVYFNNNTDSVILPTKDLHGSNRLRGSHVEIGAYESLEDNLSYKIVYVVPGNGLGNKDGRDWNHAMGNLNTAAALASAIHIDNVSTNDHPLVWVAEGVYYGDTLRDDCSFTMFDDAQVYGGFQGNEVPDLSLPAFYDVTSLPVGVSILDGLNVSRVLYQPQEFDSLTIWHGFLIQNGNYTDGAGVWLDKNGCLDNCYVSNNHASGKGGGVYANKGSILNKSTISFNSAGNDGGGVYADNAIINSSRIEKNENSNGNGGGLLADSSLIINSVVLDNDNGGIYAIHNTNIINTTVVGNSITANTDSITTGSGIICNDEVNVLNSIVWRNTRGTNDNQFQYQITRDAATVSYSAIQEDTSRTSSNGNISLAAANNKLVNTDSLLYPEFVAPDVNRRPTQNSDFINLGHPRTDSIVNTLNLPAIIDFSKDIDNNDRVIAQVVDMGAVEFQSVISDYICYDTICKINGGYTASCHNHDIFIPDSISSNEGDFLVEDYLSTNDTIFYYAQHVYIMPVPIPPSVSDVHVCNFNEITDLNHYVGERGSGTLYWAVNNGDFTVQTPPVPTDSTYYSLFYLYDNSMVCYSDTVSFSINDNMELTITDDDTISMCYQNTYHISYVYEPDAQWSSSDESIATVDSLGVIFGVNTGFTFIHYRKGACGHDSIGVIIYDVPEITAVDPTRDTVVSILELTDYSVNVAGTWSVDDYAKADIDPDGTLRPNDTGTVNLFFTSLNGCVAAKRITIQPCACAFSLANNTAFRTFRDSVNVGGSYAGFSGANGFAGCRITQTNTFQDLETNWVPVGTKAHPFKGHYLGNTKTILLINIQGSNDTVGMFGHIVGATLEGIRFCGDPIGTGVTTWSKISGGNVVGGLVGYARNSKIIQCTAGPQIEGNSQVGGLIGVADNCEIKGCLNIATITSSNGPCGGIVGNAINTEIKYCVNSGWVKSPNNDVFLGGIVGQTNDTISGCWQTNCVGIPPHHSTNGMGAFVGNALQGTTIMNSVFDKQLCPITTHNGNADIINSSGKLTREMLGSTLLSNLVPREDLDLWESTPTTYPHIVFSNATIPRIVSSTVVLPDIETAEAVSEYSVNFEGSNNVKLIERYAITCKDTLVVLQFIRAAASPKHAGVKEVPLYIKPRAEIAVSSTNELQHFGDTARICIGDVITLTATPINASMYFWTYRAPNGSDNSSFINTGLNNRSVASEDGFLGTNEGWYIVEVQGAVCTTRDSIYLQEKFCQDTINLCENSSHTINYTVSPNLWTSNDAAIATMSGNVITTHAPGITTLYHARGTGAADSVVLVVFTAPDIVESDTSIHLNDVHRFRVIPETPGTWVSSNSDIAFIRPDGTLAPNDTGTVSITFHSDYGCISSPVNVHILSLEETCSFIIVATRDSLRNFSNAVNTGGIVYDINGLPHSASNGLAGCTITLNGDCLDTINNWIPIGTHDYPFKGTFDGNNFGINGININQSENKDTVGFFGFTVNATIHNFTVGNSGGSCTLNGNTIAGGLVGYARNTHIYNCNVSTFVTGNESVGGIVGYAVNSLIENSTNIATIMVKAEGFGGGIAGNANLTCIKNCLNAGWIKRGDERAYLAGICGKTNDSVLSCLNVGVIGTPPRAVTLDRMGNLAGYCSGNTVITNCAFDTIMNSFHFPIAHGLYSTPTVVLDNTGNLLNANLQSCLGNQWIFPNDSLYPYPKLLNNDNDIVSNVIKAAVSPLYLLQAGETLDSICAAHGEYYFVNDGLSWTNANPLTQCWTERTQHVIGVEINSNDMVNCKREIAMYIHENSANIEYVTSGIAQIEGNVLTIDELADLTLIAHPDHQADYLWLFEFTQENNEPFFADVDNNNHILSTPRFTFANTGWYILKTTSPNCVSQDSIYIDIILNSDAVRLCENGETDLTFTPVSGAGWNSQNNNIATVTPAGHVAATGLGTVTLYYANGLTNYDTAVIVVTALPHIIEGDTTIKLNRAPYFHVSPNVEGVWKVVENAHLTDIDSINGRLFPNDTGRIQLCFVTAGGCSSDTVTVTIDTCNCRFPLSHRSNAIRTFRDAVNSGGDFVNSRVDAVRGDGNTYSAENGFAGCHIEYCKCYDINPIIGDYDFSTQNKGNDSDLSRWEPIGTPSHPFKGTFDGNSHSISRISTSDATQDTVGFFGYIQNATIIDFPLAGRNQTKIIGHNFVGGLVGYAKNSKIINCCGSPKVEGNNHVGGMVGYADNTLVDGVTNIATVTVKGENGTGGGIVGTAHNSNITNCFNGGWVKTTATTAYLGGIVGQTSDTVAHCVNTGTVGTPTHTSVQNMGAICGNTSGAHALIDSCFYDKQICPLDAFSGNASANVTHSTAKLTSEMVGSGIQNQLTASNNPWIFTDNLYPRLVGGTLYTAKRMGDVAASVLSFDYIDENVDIAGKFSVNYADPLVNWNGIDTVTECYPAEEDVVIYAINTFEGSKFTAFKEIPMRLYQGMADILADVGYVVSYTNDTLSVYEHDSITFYLTSTDANATYLWSSRDVVTPFYDIADLSDRYIHSTGCGLTLNNSGWYFVDLEIQHCNTRDSIYLNVLPSEDTLRLCNNQSVEVFGYMQNAEWTVDDPSIASIVNDTITALNNGETYLHFQLANHCVTDSIWLIVCELPEIMQQDTSVFIRSITNFTVNNNIDGVWVSGDERIASVDALTGRFAPNDTGRVTLFFYSDCGGCPDSILVTIYDTCDCAFNLPHRTDAIKAFRNAVNSGGIFTWELGNYGGDGLDHSAVNGFAGCTITFSTESEFGNNSSLSSWVPIGTPSHPFKGKFNGNGRKVSRVSNTSNNIDTLGFFGYVEGAEIYNFIVACGNSASAIQYFNGSTYVGGLVGYAKNSYIHNCVVSPFVSGNRYVGGAVGYADNCVVEYMTNLGTISVNQAGGYGGGIVGGALNSPLRNSINTGWIKRSDVNAYIGGLVGYTNDSITKSFNVGVVGTPPHTVDTLRLGALCGFAANSCVIDSCINDKQMAPLDNLVGQGTPSLLHNRSFIDRDFYDNYEGLVNQYRNWYIEPNYNRAPRIVNEFANNFTQNTASSLIGLGDGETVDSVSAFVGFVDNGVPTWVSQNMPLERDSLVILQAYYNESSHIVRKEVPVYMLANAAKITYTTDTIVRIEDNVLFLGEGAHLTLSASPDSVNSYTWTFRDGGISMPFYTFEEQHDKVVSTGENSFAVTNAGWYILEVNHSNNISKDSIYVMIDQLDWLFNYDVSWFTQNQGNNSEINTYNHIYAGYGEHEAGSSPAYPYLISDAYDLRGLAKIVNGGAKMTDSLCNWIDGVGSATQTSEALAPLAIAAYPHITQSDSCFNFAGKYIRMTQNIELNDEVFSRNDTGALLINGAPYDHYLNHFSTQIRMWDPIGYYVHGTNEDKRFRGVFDGNNDTISGVYIYYDALNLPKHAYQGLFGYVADTIKNLTLSNSYFGSNNEGMMDIRNTPGGLGSIACFMDGCALLNCHTDTNVTINGVGAGRVGGLVANVSSSPSSNSIISKCTNGAEIFGRVHTYQSETNIGGIVGVSNGTISGTALPNGTCINNGSIHVTRIGGDNLHINIGGIAGKVSSTPYSVSRLNSCVNNGNVIIGQNATQSSALNYFIGGVAGVCEGAKVTGISNNGDIENASGFAGGICGELRDYRSGDSVYVQGDISNLRITGVRFHVNDNGIGDTRAYGCGVGLMRDKSQMTHISVTDIEMDLDISSSADTIPLKTYVGMLVGEMQDSTYVNSVEIMDNNLTMQVTVDSAQINLYVGAAVGYIADTGCIFDYCRMQGEFNITVDSADNSTFPIHAAIGGFVGKSNGRILNAASLNTFNYTGHCNNLIGKFGGLAGINNGYIVNCHSHNTLNLDSTSIIEYVGGLIGLNDTNGVLSNVYSFESFRPAGHSRGTIYGGAVVGGNRGLVEYAYRKPSQLHGIPIPFVGNSTATATLRDTAYFVDYHGALTAPDTYPYALVLCDALNCWVAENTNPENEGTYYTWVVDGYSDAVYQGYPHGGTIADLNLNAGQVGYDQYILYDSIPNIIGNILPGENWGTGTYQWQDSTRLHGWQDIINAHDSIYIPTTPNTDTTWYRRVYNSNCQTITSNVVPVFIYEIEIAHSGLTTYGDTSGVLGDTTLLTTHGHLVTLPSLDRYGQIYNYPPFVVTNTIDSITATTVQVYGTIAHEGTSAVTEAGFQISTASDFSVNPRTSGNITRVGNEFKYRFNGLTADTTYYVRAYAVNTEGTAYGNTFTFTTSD